MKVRAFILAALVLAGCDSTKIFDEAVDFESRSWKVTEPVQFEFAVSNDTAAYDLSCTLRNSLEYPYARLFLHYSLQDSAGHELAKKMEVTYLFDQKTGEPQGSSGLGDVYDHRLALLKSYKFPYKGKYKMKLEQVMRLDTLQGILAVGLLVEPSLPK